MTDTNNTDGAALLPCPLCDDPMKKDNAGTFGHTDSNAKCLLARQAWALMPSYVDAWNTRAPLPATQEDAERSGADVDTVAKIIDPDAWHETLPTDGCGAYWIGRRNDARAKASAIRVALAKGAASHE